MVWDRTSFALEMKHEMIFRSLHQRSASELVVLTRAVPGDNSMKDNTSLH